MAIIGVVTRAAVQQLEGMGRAVGAKLTPGALRAFGIARPARLRDESVAAETLIEGERREWSVEDPELAVRALEAYLLSLRPKNDSISSRANEIVHAAESDRNIVSVTQLADAFSLSVRSIQDVCNRAIGVSPKWIIRCFRLQDALERLETGKEINLSSLAQDLGYFDQAHFTRDFKHVTGVTPGRY